MQLVTEENIIRYTNCETNIFKWILKSKSGFDVINWPQNFYQRRIWPEYFSFPPNTYIFRGLGGNESKYIMDKQEGGSYS